VLVLLEENLNVISLVSAVTELYHKREQFTAVMAAQAGQNSVEQIVQLLAAYRPGEARRP